ncbi:MAG TPA: class I SAM-dependent methyltransferase [Candidatus Angelobacter sp.]|nr:class I SAM-dependent methyltransferase [Candidatus Angelobacter sp.]
MRWFRGSEVAQPKPAVKTSAGPRSSRRSTGFAEFTRSLTGYKDLSALDLGPTSSANIAFLTGFGGRVHNEDILRASQDRTYLARQEDGSEMLDPQKFLSENLDYPEHRFDAILCWDIPDYLPEVLVKPMVERIHKIVKPGGILLAFFHTKDAGPDSPYCRYHIVSGEVLDLEPRPDFRLQRVFNNRHIENLFKGFSSLKFFLARDNIREVLVVR